MNKEFLGPRTSISRSRLTIHGIMEIKRSIEFKLTSTCEIAVPKPIIARNESAPEAKKKVILSVL